MKLTRAVCLLITCAAYGQFRQDDPLLSSVTAIFKAREQGRFTDAATLRENARTLLERLPVDAPQFGGFVQSVAQLYSGGGRTAQARGVLQSALDRAPVTSPVRIQLLTSISDSWRQDRNLLKAADYLEKAVAVLELAPATPPPTPPVAGHWFRVDGPPLLMTDGKFSRRAGQDTSLSPLYQRLADLQQQLGHPDAVAALHVKMRALAAKSGDRALASYLEQQGQLAQAAAMYKISAERAATAQEAASALQSLANIYVRQENFADAAAAQQQAIARLEAAGTPDMRNQATGARQTLARFLEQAGHVEQADAVYQGLLAQGGAEQHLQLLVNYARFLSSTQRSAQATALLKEFQASHSTLQPWEESGLYSALSNMARASGDSKKSDEYLAALRARQPQQPDSAGQPSLESLFQKALSAASAGKAGEAFALAMQAMDAAPRSQNRDQVGWQVPSIASSLSAGRETANGELLYRRAFALTESWSADSLQPLVNLASNYALFLIMQRDRQADVPAAIERYRNLLVASAGEDSGTLEEALRLTINFERARTPSRASPIPAQGLVAFEESVNGITSEPYLRALRTLAETYAHNGDRGREIPVRKRTVEIADLVYLANDQQRSQTRVDAALALAHQGQFDEADQLAAEAAAIGQAVKPARGVSFEYAIQEIRKIRAAYHAPR